MSLVRPDTRRLSGIVECLRWMLGFSLSSKLPVLAEPGG